MDRLMTLAGWLLMAASAYVLIGMRFIPLAVTLPGFDR